MKFFSIGVYHSTKEEFFRKLQNSGVDVLVDIRRRRGLRGKDYSFANSKKLQEQLQEMNIRYVHVPGLSPTQSMIQAQDESDNKQGISRRDRTNLTPEFKMTYRKEILEGFDLEELVNQLKEEDAQNVALFCVEKLAKACHRSIVTIQLRKMEYPVKHL